MTGLMLMGQVGCLTCLHMDYMCRNGVHVQELHKLPNSMLVLGRLYMQQTEKCWKRSECVSVCMCVCMCVRRLQRHVATPRKKKKKTKKKKKRRQMRGEDRGNRQRRGKDYYHSASGLASHP